MKLWIARDEKGSLYLYDEEPTKESGYFYSYGEDMGLDIDIFPEVTFENSPMEVELKLYIKNDTKN